MEPLSIAASATALAAFALQTSKAVYSCIDSVKSVDKTLGLLHAEVNTLQLGLTSVASTFASDHVVEYWEATAHQKSQSRLLVASVESLLLECKEVLDGLTTILDGLLPNPSTSRLIPRKPVKALGMMFKQTEIDLARQQLRAYSSAMQMTLQMVSISMSIDNSRKSGQLGVDFEQRLIKLAAQVEEVRDRVSETRRTSDSVTSMTSSSGQTEQNAGIYLEHHVRTAITVLSSASTRSRSPRASTIGGITASDTSTAASEFAFGIALEQERRVLDWDSAEQPSEDLRLANTDAVDDSLFEARLTVARQQIAQGKFSTAAYQLELCMADTNTLKTKASHVRTDIALDLALAFRCLGKADEQQATLRNLLEDNDLTPSQVLQIKHNLAVTYLEGGLTETAEQYALETLRGRQKLFGQHHELFHETAALLVDMAQMLGNWNDAEVYRRFLPKNYSRRPTTNNLSSLSPELLAAGPAGYSIFDPDTYWQTLSWAEQKAMRKLLDVLLPRANDLSQRLESGYTLLMIAAKHNLVDTMATLIARGVNADLTLDNGFTALHVAIQYGRTSSALLLIPESAFALNANSGKKPREPRHAPNGAPSGYGTPLVWATMMHNVDVVRALLAAGAYMSTYNEHGYSPLHTAAENGDTAIVRLLLQYGANVHDEAPSVWGGRTPLKLAKQHRHQDIVSLLRNRLD